MASPEAVGVTTFLSLRQAGSSLSLIEQWLIKEILELSGVHTGGRGPPFTTVCVCGCFGCNCLNPCLPNPVVYYKSVINISC